MIRITQLRLPVDHSEEDLRKKAAHAIHRQPSDIRSLELVRRSIDARDKNNLLFVYTVDVSVRGEKRILEKSRHNNIMSTEPFHYDFPKSIDFPKSTDLAKSDVRPSMEQPPIIIGSGPAGLFCAWMLARHGYRPILLERGEEASKRRETVRHFWQGGPLDPESNVQFGEGGAGTFSDGKLNTGVKDKHGRNREVLRIFVQAGAPEDILYDAKPHLGTDNLVKIVEKLRSQIISWGGSVHFRSRVDSLLLTEKSPLTGERSIRGVRTADGKEYYSNTVVLAIGHSARDTFLMLNQKGIPMEAKPFAVGVRVEHPQSLITRDQYGENAPSFLGPAPYKLAHTLENGRGVYSFCMCPGGYVINASSEPGELAVNGMSYHDRNSGNANSAIVVTVRPEDFRNYHKEGTDAVLDGMYFQRYLEARAFQAGDGAVPVQRFEDFRKGQKGNSGSFAPCIKGAYTWANVRSIFPDALSESIENGILAFDRKIIGFGQADVLLSGVESRTSSPIRILRDDSLQSSIRGLYPCGEGAGYAGGITSAAMDGLKVAEAIASLFKPF